MSAPMSDSLIEEYVRTALKLGIYDSDYVDAYFGPDEWKPFGADAKREDHFPADHFSGVVDRLMQEAQSRSLREIDPLGQLRFKALGKNLRAMKTRMMFLNGTSLSFDEESAALYDAVAPEQSEIHYQEQLQDLSHLLPGNGTVSERLQTFRNQFVIPKEKLDRVFQTAIAEGRHRSQQRISLPEHEKFIVEYVTNKAWSGYNWYKGNCYSVIQVNTDFPITIDRAVDLACHEGYPGHHVYNSLMELQCVRKRGWMEYSVYPLFSPQSLLAEGTANFGIEVAFPEKERNEFEREQLFPIAALDASRVDEYYTVHALTQKLQYAGNEAARGYLDGKMSAEKAVEWLIQYALYSPDRAQQRLRFIEKYRSYVINYNLGQDLVRNWIEKQGGTPRQPERRWELYCELISSPHTPSDLKEL
jgi:hypothetical protein